MVEVVEAAQFSARELTDIMNTCYEQYSVPIHLNTEQMCSILRVDAVDLVASKVALDSSPVALALVARRGWTSRLGALAVVPDRRGQSIGGHLLNCVLAQSRERGDKAMVLEVIESNTGAVELYKRAGFRTTARLVGYSGEKIAVEEAPIEEITFLQVAAAMGEEGQDLPWQVGSEAVAQLASPWKAWLCRSATCCTLEINNSLMVLRGLTGSGEDLTALLRGLAHNFSGRIWKVSPTYPEGLHQVVFQDLGFHLEPLTQLHMKLAF